MIMDMLCGRRIAWVLLFVFIGVIESYSHFQQFENGDATMEKPIEISDFQTSYAWYGTLNYPGDVDYFTFNGTKGQEVLLYILFPVIENASEFYPSLALIGPGLPQENLPDEIVIPQGAGEMRLEYTLDQLDEMAHGNVYKYPPPMELALPEDGKYHVAIWHDDSFMGRYCFSHGSSHENGSSDPEAKAKIEEYWTPLTMSVDLPGTASPLQLVRIPKGGFMMGSSESEKDRKDGELQHYVTISNSFYMGRFEITQGQWNSIMGTNPSHFPGEPNRPVENVSWDECMIFVEKLNALSNVNGSFRLPTESEWEYGCRAESETRFYWGDDPELEDATRYAWFDSNSENQTHIVGQKRPNGWGLCDMTGNVWEWCSDWFGEYEKNELIDPRGPENGTSKVLRGGSWQFSVTTGRSAYRVAFPASTQFKDLGFRVVLESPQSSEINNWDLYK